MQRKQQIKRFVLENFLFSDDESEIADGDSLIQSGIVDSTGIHELVLYLEQQFDLQVGPEEMTPANFDSIDSVDNFVGRKLAVEA